MKTNFLRMTKGPILALLVTSLFSASRPSLSAGAGSDGIQLSTSVGAPTLETLQVGLEDMLDRLNLTHAQGSKSSELWPARRFSCRPCAEILISPLLRYLVGNRRFDYRLEGRSPQC